MKKYVAIIISFLCFSDALVCQKMTNATRSDDYTSLYLLNPDRNNGFEIALSAVLMFTTGAADRNGLRWGSDITLSKHVGDFSFSTGIDLYKAKQKFGLGTSYAGIIYNDSKYGFSYYVNRYYQGDKQTSGIVSLTLDDFQIRFEDDILALPFTGFTVYGRYRTAALEVRYKHILAGTNVYTNEPNGLTDVNRKNKWGTFATSRQISSPIYIGYSNKNLITRIGINSKLGGYTGQNWWHQYLFETPDLKHGSFRNPFFQIGTDKPYTLY